MSPFFHYTITVVFFLPLLFFFPFFCHSQILSFRFFSFFSLYNSISTRLYLSILSLSICLHQILFSFLVCSSLSLYASSVSFCLHLCLFPSPSFFVSVSVSLSLSQSLPLSVCLSPSLSLPLSPYLSVSICLYSVCLNLWVGVGGGDW